LLVIMMHEAHSGAAALVRVEGRGHAALASAETAMKARDGTRTCGYTSYWYLASRCRRAFGGQDAAKLHRVYVLQNE
jgi:hypothetical protein